MSALFSFIGASPLEPLILLIGAGCEGEADGGA